MSLLIRYVRMHLKMLFFSQKNDIGGTIFLIPIKALNIALLIGYMAALKFKLTLGSLIHLNLSRTSELLVKWDTCILHGSRGRVT